MAATSNARRRRSSYSRGKHRRSDIEKIIAARHGFKLPDTDDIDIYVQEIAYCLGRVLAEKAITLTATAIVDRLNLWCDRWAPTFPTKSRNKCARRALRMRGRLPDNETVGRRLFLLYQERAYLKITSVGCYDVDRNARKRLREAGKRKRDRERRARARALEGRQSRQEYLATHSLSREQPWIKLGISRRTYYRKYRGTEAALALVPIGVPDDVPRVVLPNFNSADVSDFAARPVRCLGCCPEIEFEAGGVRAS